MIAALALLLVAHGPSRSFADWTITTRAADVTVNFQSHDLTRSQQIEGEASLVAAVVAGTQLWSAPNAAAPMSPCTSTAGPVRSAGDPVEEVQVTLHFDCPTPIALFTASQQYLPGLSPPHITVASFTTPGGTTQHTFGPETPTVTRRAAPDAPDSQLPWLAALATLALLGALATHLTRRRR